MRRHFRTDTRLDRIRNLGHLNRHGHPITGYYVGEGLEQRLIRTCCGESE